MAHDAQPHKCVHGLTGVRTLGGQTADMVMAYILLLSFGPKVLALSYRVTTYIVMACIFMAYIVMA